MMKTSKPTVTEMIEMTRTLDLEETGTIEFFVKVLISIPRWIVGPY